MGVIYQTETRSTIPKLRSFDVSATTGELYVRGNKKAIIETIPRNALEEQKDQWNKNHDLPHAADLLSSAYVLGREYEFKEAAKFIIDNEINHITPISKLAKHVLGIKEELEIDPLRISNRDNFLSKYYPQIRKYKSYLNVEPRNPIAWVELCRLYILLGEKEKATKCINNALSLDKNNRYIVRSASRFYFHIARDEEYALKIIKNSSYLKNDPWLLSAEIAYSTILKRHSTMVKSGKEFLKQNIHSPFSITELASALGTFEFRSGGSIKEARKYFSQSVIKPNENSLAQYLWMVKDVNNQKLDISSLRVPLAFEASAQDQYNKNNYKESLASALKWFEDEPYSTRPILLSSFLQCTFLEDDFAKGISLLKTGLQINPDDIALNNNLVYYLIQEGSAKSLEEAERIYTSKLLKYVVRENHVIESSKKAALIATAGLIFYRSNEIEKGRLLYQKAISLAKKSDNKYVQALATVNYIKEEFNVTKNKDDLKNLINQLNDATKDVTEPDIILLKKKTTDQYYKILNDNNSLLFDK